MTALLRNLRHSPAFVLTVIATLALGVGLNTALFTVVDSVLLRPLGYHNADRLVAIETRFLSEDRNIPRVAGDDFTDMTHGVPGLASAAFYSAYDAGIALGGRSLYAPIAEVGPHFTEALGVEPLAGRLFRPTDTVGGDALVSAAFAREHLGTSAAAVGSALLFNGRLFSIAGVLPDGFAFPDKTSVWIEETQPQVANRGSYNEHVVARMRPGVSLAQLNAQLDTFSHHLQRAYPEDGNKALLATSLQEQLVGSVRPTLRLLMGAVAVLLLIVAANLTHLQLVRSTRELRAVTIRTALGASRRALATRARIECVLLGVGGAVAALAIASVALRLLTRLAPPDLPRLADVRLNPEVFAFSLLASLAVMLLTALLPIWRSWHLEPAAVLRAENSRGSASRTAVRLRDGLLVAEIALTLTLSVLALLVTRQLLAQSREDLGFAPEHLVVLDVHRITSPTAVSAVPLTPAEHLAAGLAAGPTNLAHLDDTLDVLARQPGVQAVGAIRGAPMGYPGSNAAFVIRGKQVFAPPFLNLPEGEIRTITPTLPATLGIPLLHGRALTSMDTLASPKVTLINQALARRYFPDSDPLGKQVQSGYDNLDSPWTIVGIVGDIHDDSPAAAPAPTFYIPAAQHPYGIDDLQLAVRTSLPAASAVNTLTRALLRAHPEIAVQATTMREAIGVSQLADRFRSTLFAAFAAVSLLLAAVGIYGVTAYSVAERRFEFGLRFALGATRPQVLGLVLRRALLVAGVGTVVGLVLSLGLDRLLRSLLEHPPALDLLSPLAAALALLTLSALATLVPARRAALTDPAQTLRSE